MKKLMMVVLMMVVSAVANAAETVVAPVGVIAAEQVGGQQLALAINGRAGGGSQVVLWDGYTEVPLALAIAPSLAYDAGISALYVASHNVVLKYDFVTQSLNTYAGTGVSGYSGDGGSALAATFDVISDIDVDNTNGNLLIADKWNGLRLVDNASGTVSTISNLARCSTAAFDHKGNIFAACEGVIWKIAANGLETIVSGKLNAPLTNIGDNGAAINAVNSAVITDLAIDDLGRIFIADAGLNRVRMIDEAGVITTVLGDGGTSGVDSFAYPSSLSLDTFGVVYAVSGINGKVVKLNITTTTIETTAATQTSQPNGCLMGNASGTFKFLVGFALLVLAVSRKKNK